MTDYEAIYATWDDLPDCRIKIPGERVWGKELPDGTFGINNVPLGDGFRLHDIVRSKDLDGLNLAPIILHRRWNRRVEYRFDEPKYDVAALKVRQAIVDALEPLGLPGFFLAGFGYLLIKEATDEDHVMAVTTLLGGIGVLVLSGYQD